MSFGQHLPLISLQSYPIFLLSASISIEFLCCADKCSMIVDAEVLVEAQAATSGYHDRLRRGVAGPVS